MNEWINIDDHLPLNGDRVLVVSLGVVYLGYFQTQYNTSFGSIPNSFRDHADGRYEQVTHWMHLPLPPEVA